MAMKENRLAQEKSPYLRQHAHNPVDWFPWGPEAFAKAQAENKLIFLSIGYSTCYWCHVMEKECFEREEVAAPLNQDFISVKVDREEHPEVDEIYMAAVIAMNRQGGWPMSVFLTPDLKPFWGGTYVPRPQFLDLLARVQEAWREHPAQIRAGGEKLLQYLQTEDEAATLASPLQETLEKFLQQSSARFDPLHGGFGPAPKFPSTMTLRLLLRLKSPAALPMVERSLEAMASGGIYDQLGGGFHRYSTDVQWLVPHFEKMLYDNALLAVVYLEAFQRTSRALYRQIATETLDYLLRDMRSPDGGFFAAEDAGDVGAEGEFYVWSLADLQKSLTPELLAELPFPVSEAGNFEHTNILANPRASLSEEARRLLLKTRNQRPRPHRDEKILTAWNGLALTALAQAGAVLGEEKFLAAAQDLATFVRTRLWDGKNLLRRYCEGEAKYFGTASDYAYFIEGLITLYQADWNEDWLLWARTLQERMDTDFWDDKQGGYFTAAAQETNLIVRKKDRDDGALPSPNSVALRNLYRLAQYFQDPAQEARAEKLRSFLQPLFTQIPFAAADAIQSLFFASHETLVLRGTEGREFQKLFLPGLSLLCARADESALPLAAGKSVRPAAYFCEHGACLAPLSPGEALAKAAQRPLPG